MNSYDHPGKLVKKLIRERRMTVSYAASALGVGRPALSTFINEKSALSISMAFSLQGTFGLDATSLLIEQLNYDIEKWRRAGNK